MLRAVLAAGSVLAAALLPAVAAGADGDGYERVVDLTFPVAGDVVYSDTYHADRSGGARKHQATDVMADKLQKLHAAVAGEICSITGIDEPMPSWGYALSICGDDGLRYNYLHVNNDSPGTDDGAGGVEWAYAPGLREGVRVERGEFVGYVGDSGNSEGTEPHLHFEISDPELDDPALTIEPYKPDRLNPFPSLEDARRRGDIPDAEQPQAFTPPPSSPPQAPPAPERTPSPEPSPEPSPDPEPETAPEPALGPPPAPAPSAPAASDQMRRVVRVYGPTRVQTAIALSSSRHGESRAVVVVPAGSHVEALVAAPLAAVVDAPVLLTGPDGLDGDVADEIRRLGARSAYLVGTTQQLAASTEDDLAAAGITAMARLAAPDRYALSAAIARELISYPTVDNVDRVLLALGESGEAHRSWPDALSASALAAHLRVPILLTRGDGLPDAVADVLDELRPSVVTVVGGRGAISDATAEAAADAADGADVQRLSGPTRYGTSVAVARAAVDAGLRASSVWIATGRNFPDALAAGPAAAASGAPLLLVDGQTVGGAPESEEWLSQQAGRVDDATIVGGAGAVSEDVARDIARRLDG